MAVKIGILKETKNQWESRIPLTPEQIAQLQSENPEFQFVVMPSEQRVFRENEFADLNIEMADELEESPIILGVKEIPIPYLRPRKTYLFFSHTIKGQAYNMPMLQRLLDDEATLIDYELIKDDTGRRLVFFGRHAGMAGMIDSLWALGQRWQTEGLESPFARLKPAKDYGHSQEIKSALKLMGKGLPEFLKTIPPVIVGFAGYGNVSKGAQEIFDILPHEEIEPDDLPGVAARKSANRLYKVVFNEEHLVRPRHYDGKFELQEYYQFPERYVSIFDQYMPHLTVLVNCIYWDTIYPRLVTKHDVWKLYRDNPKLKVIGDISCDIEGAIECNMGATDSGDPVYVYLPEEDRRIMGVKGRGPVIMAVDNLPTELPRESSEAFGKALMPFIPNLASCDFDKPFEELDLPPELKRAVIAHQGRLTPDFEYLANYLETDKHMIGFFNG
ncbi:MAG: hypothetical protein K9N34_09850 [Candidatus Marinimicrobia bacterium]|nr:hypothetical protein [Candidatus Neomarinimicrobiota bacterium]MCF7840890.1 hypothetical protein [Candidatus Neomarinimicrobiota bacterium]